MSNNHFFYPPPARTYFRRRVWFFSPPPPITGTVDVTEAADTTTASGATSVANRLWRLRYQHHHGTGWFYYGKDHYPVTRGGFAVVAPVSDAITGTVDVTEGADTSSTAGALVFTGTLDVTEGADTSSTAGELIFTGTVDVTEGADTSSTAGSLVFTGTADVTEGADTSSTAGEQIFTGTLDVTEASDTTATAGALVFTGTVDVTETADTLATVGVATEPNVLWRIRTRLHYVPNVHRTDVFAVRPPSIVVSSQAPPLVGTASITEGADTTATVGIYIPVNRLWQTHQFLPYTYPDVFYRTRTQMRRVVHIISEETGAISGALNITEAVDSATAAAELKFIGATPNPQDETLEAADTLTGVGNTPKTGSSGGGRIRSVPHRRRAAVKTDITKPLKKPKQAEPPEKTTLSEVAERKSDILEMPAKPMQPDELPAPAPEPDAPVEDVAARRADILEMPAKPMREDELPGPAPAPDAGLSDLARRKAEIIKLPIRKMALDELPALPASLEQQALVELVERLTDDRQKLIELINKLADDSVEKDQVIIGLQGRLEETEALLVLFMTGDLL